MENKNINRSCPYYTTKPYPCANPELRQGTAEWCCKKDSWLISEYYDGTHESDCDRCELKLAVKSPTEEIGKVEVK